MLNKRLVLVKLLEKVVIETLKKIKSNSDSDELRWRLYLSQQL